MNQYDTREFRRDLAEWNISLTEKQIDQFLRYYEMLEKWNGKMNLTTIREYGEVIKKHFIDSLSLVKACGIAERELTGKLSVIDVGTGAGFPGLALKIAFPDLEMTLMDSLNKRVSFLDAVIKDLSLSGVKTVHGRAEDCARREGFREQFDLCLSRAVANLSVLSEYCLPFVKIGGAFVSYKSEKVSEEMKQAEHAISLLGGEVKGQVEFMLPHSDIYRNLVVIEKRKKTPLQFPRKAGLPAKAPISV